MSKAFKCDSCLELCEGEPSVVENGFDICDNCVRIAHIFRKVDPMAVYDPSDSSNIDISKLAFKDTITIIPR